MGYTVLQAGTSLQFMDTSGTLTTLTLPTGVTLDSTKRPRFTIFGRYVVVVNSPTRPLTVDADGVVRVLTPNAPRNPVTLGTAASGTLTGTYLVKQSYIVTDPYGVIIAESPLGPVSASQAVSAQYLAISAIDLSNDTISADRLYRTTTGGTSTFFPWLDLEGNTQTTTQDDLADAALSLVAAPTLGAPPRLTLVGEFRERLWGVSLTSPDYLRYTEASKMYAWPSTNSLIVPKLGADDRGITGILPRREALAIGRVNSLVQIVGESNTDFRVVKLSLEVGVEAPDSVAQYRDTIYFLWKDGVYTWSDAGIKCVSDGKVRSWFTTSSYFNRAQFPNAVGRIDPIRNKYQLLLASAGSTALDRWVEYDLTDETWWGPHKTDAFTTTYHTTTYDSSGLVQPLIGSSAGFFYKEQDTRTDGTSTAIDFDVDGKFHDMKTPDIEKHFGELALISDVQPSGTLTITPYVGGLDAIAGTPFTADMTKGRERLPRVGDGRFAKLNFRHTGVGQNVELLGFELEFFERGRR